MRCLAVILILFACGAPAQSSRVLVIDIDDLGWDMLASTPTPTFDRLSAEGRRFTRFHTTPMCSPSRARLQLGALGSHPLVLCGHTVKPNLDYELPLGPLIPLPRLATEHGRTTAKIGKWHLAPNDRPEHPNQFGWQTYAGAFANLNLANPGDFFAYQKIVDGERIWHDVYVTTDETNDAIRCVEERVDLISVSYHAIHNPYHVPPPELYDGPPPTSDFEMAQAMLQALDLELGRLLDAALAADYTVFVLSDNGTSTKIGGGKGHLVPGGVIVPMWVVGPGVVPGTDDEWVDIVDLYATVADVMGIPRDRPAEQGPDSISFAPRLYGSPGATREAVYSEFWLPNGKDPRQLGPKQTWYQSLRTREWALISNDKNDLGLRFHDRILDPREEHDLLERGMDAAARDAMERLLTMLAGI